MILGHSYLQAALFASTEDRDHMDNETRHLEVALGDIYVVSNYVTPASQSVDISLHNTDDTLRRIKVRIKKYKRGNWEAKTNS